MTTCPACGYQSDFEVAACPMCGAGAQGMAATALEPGRRAPSLDATILERGDGRRELTTTGAYLFVREGPDRGLQAPVPPLCTIGRDPENGLVLSDRRVSGRHGLIRAQDQRFTYQDLLGTNGSYLRGPAGEVRIRGSHRLADGDLIRIGHTVLQFILIDEGA